MPIPDTLLGGLSPAAFLETYWQKEPLLVRGALPGFVSPVSPAGLQALAGHDDADARLVLERGGHAPWELHHGPFEPDYFDGLPASHWSLLVQEVHRFVPEVAALRDLFRFIPTWRHDDVMISYAPQAGGVGAHVDNYDVFLLQGLGRRRWQISRTPLLEEEVLEPDLDVSILADFEPDEDWVLEPGDMLYLPPRIPHYGVALDACMTYSIGFRAPSYDELLVHFVECAAARFDPLARYRDPDLQPQEHPGEIRPDALEQVRAVIRSALSDDAAIDDWFGCFITEPRRGHYALPPDDPVDAATLRARLKDGAVLRRSAAALFAYRAVPDGAVLYVNGAAYDLPPALSAAAPLLSGIEPLTAGVLAPYLADEAFVDLLADLVNEGNLELQAGDAA